MVQRSLSTLVGPSGYGCVILDGSKRIWDLSGLIEASPTNSNNQAEYLAFNNILDWFIDYNLQTESICIYGDSKLVIEQMFGKWKIHGVDSNKPKGLYADHAVVAREKLKQFSRTKGFWIPREENSLADELSKRALKLAGVEFRIQPEPIKPTTRAGRSLV